MAKYVTWAAVGAFGIGAFLIALGFGFGSGPRIGSAVFPLMMSGAIVLVALWGLITTLTGAPDERDDLEFRPFLAVTGAVMVFILTIDWLGMVPAVVGSMIVAYLGQDARGYGAFLVYAVLFAGATWLLFAMGLNLPVPAFGGR